MTHSGAQGRLVQLPQVGYVVAVQNLDARSSPPDHLGQSIDLLALTGQTDVEAATAEPPGATAPAKGQFGTL